MAPHTDPGFRCTVCDAHLLTARPCPLCGSAVVEAGAATTHPTTLTDPFGALRAKPHRVLLAVGLVATASSLLVAVGLWMRYDQGAAVWVIGGCALVSLAMLLPWKQRHNPSGADPVPMQVPREEFTSAAGVSLNPAITTFAQMGWPVPFVGLLVAGMLPLLLALSDGPEKPTRMLAVGLAWVGAGALWLRHVRREIEADSSIGRGVPL